ncbi:MAG TPA: response regulator [Spirochaetota bacterium]|nr:response regulator [Spirochaetota bacterium]
MTNILVVEDDKPSGLILKKLLDKSGYNVTDVVESGEDAMNTIIHSKPDLILMDISLAGEIDGIETAERIYQTHNVPFIYITAGTDDTTFERAKKSLPLNYIVKPFNSKMLNSAIEIALFKFDLESRLKQSENNKNKILESLPDKIFEINADISPCSTRDNELLNELWPDKIKQEAKPYIERAISNDSIEIFEYEINGAKNKIYFESRIIRIGEDLLLVITRDNSAKKKEEANLSSHINEMEGAIKERTGELQKLNRTLTDEIDKRNLIEEEIKLFMDVVEQSTNSIVIIEKNGIVKYANRAFSELSGYTKDELTGIDVTKIPNPILPEENIQKQITNVDYWKGETYNLRKNGEIYYLNASVSKVKNEKGKTKYIVVSAEDITDFKKDQIALERMKSTIKNSASDSIDKDMAWQTWKEKMLSRNISRTDRSIFSNINNSFTQGAGFGTLITFMEMMAKSAEEKDGNRIVDGTLFSEAMKNVKIAQDAFKIFAGIDWIISNNIDLEDILVREVYSLIKGTISKNNRFADLNKHRIVINDLPKGLKDKRIKINPQYFTEAMSELIINALKFSRAATNIIVMVYSQNNTLRISVISDPQKSSDGIVGIPEEFEKVIFEPFYRLSKLVYEKYNTLDFGIGLTFVEKIITRHGGEIFAENIVDYSDVTKDPQIKVNLMISLPFVRE